MANFPTQLDEIDQWLVDNFDIIPGACSSTENLRYNTAKMVAEALWPKKDPIADDSKKDSSNSRSSNDLEEAARHSEILTYPMPEDGDIEKVMKVQEARIFHEIGFKAGANWQKEQLGDLCCQCEKNYDNVFFKGEQHAIKMMEKETISGEVVQNYSGEYALYIKAKLPRRTYLKFGDKVAVYIFKKNTL